MQTIVSCCHSRCRARIPPAAPQVDHRAAVHDDAHGRADFVLAAVVVDKGIEHGMELRLATAVDGHQALTRAEGFVELDGHRQRF